MEQIKILFFVIGSFFGLEDGKIAADTTTVTINPIQKEITIVQEKLFTVIQTVQDKETVLKQWNLLYNSQDTATPWAKELTSFTNKTITYQETDGGISPKITLQYKTEEDLRALGIWYSKEKNQFSINHIPQQHLKTEDGKQDGNYWFFNATETFSFSLQPFIELPEQYKKLIVTIEELVTEE